MGVNVSVEFMEMACTFLNCIKGGVPFKYLGLPVGANPRRLTTWAPLLESLRKKLNTWGNKHISLGGRLVLINSVLNSIPIFYLSFMKMPAQVLKKVIRIQREFLWGGVNGGKKLSWIKWKVVCQEKKNGGLGVRDLKAVNLSLLMKWRWRLLQRGEVGLWKEVLVAKYGAHILNKVSWSNVVKPYFASLWWNDLCDLETCVDSKNWVVEAIYSSLGNGAQTSFWCDKWIGDASLSVRFPRLFSLSLQKEAFIREVVVIEDNTKNWNLVWRRRLFQWEEDSLNQLLVMLEEVRLSHEEDKWRWSFDPEGCFSVKSAYDEISKEIVGGLALEPHHALIFEKIWDSPAPSKVIVFSWQLLHDRVPTKENMLVRGILPDENGGGCVWCPGVSESSSHLFLHCKVAMEVWYEIFKWLGVVIVMPPTLFHLFDCLSEAVKAKKSRKGFRL
ncbi:LINE-1 reverse transcriptase like, partial [Trifolium medium]|nr:LINE-1 reverse transcriptase like [Trifolium medium]